MTRSCASCAYFLRRAFIVADTDPADLWTGGPDDRGACRRYPPRLFTSADSDESQSLFVSVHEDQLCGEHRPKGMSA